MNQLFSKLGFAPADILIPWNCDLSKWSVVACDQYTSQPEYWERVAQTVGDAPSALNLVFPESQLHQSGVEERICRINRTMEDYLASDRFRKVENGLIYVERWLDNGKLRRGLVGVVDLECYEFAPGNAALTRATEGTVLARIPPRVAVRRNAALELPHVLMLLDDPDCQVIEHLTAESGQMEQLYDFDLMERGGHITGYLLSDTQADEVAAMLLPLIDQAVFEEKYGAPGKAPMLFAVGDGNHSLASAKAAYEEKKGTPEGELARYALVELGNLHDESLEFEAIHRVCFHVDGKTLLTALMGHYPGAHLGEGEGQSIRYVLGDEEGILTIPDAPFQLPVGTLQSFLDGYLTGEATVDYIHGEDVTRQLCLQENTIGFILPPMAKNELFKTVIFDGVLPRKTFSMGEAHDKRFYLEARAIR
ncbi:MAG: DUF1015 domain-containing protein [Oscillospiraceae bacterium]|nr:DUF1015 domain-containing protein [Oscillospiraceae bacterium]